MFEPFINLVEVKSVVTECRDSKDNFLLELAKDSKADYILTGDKDLLDIAKFGKTKIITITAFLASRHKL
jgi:predicted nucleic acid-binding protein